MNISKLALLALLGGALMAFGCSDDESGGTAGSGGSGGSAGGGGGGGADGMCAPNTMTCQDPTINDIEACCDLAAPPTQTAACDGTESQDNPETCEATGTTIEYKLTLLSMDGDCDGGYNLDSCDGNTCLPGSLGLASEGADGVDNGLASIGKGVEQLANLSLTGVEQALSDSLCGMADDEELGICFGGADDGDPCVLTMECVGGSDDGETCIDDTGCTDVQGTCSTTVATMCLSNTDCPSGETCENADVGKCTDVSDDGCADGAGEFCVADSTIACTKANEAVDCGLDGECVAAGSCNLENDDCLAEVPALELFFVVDANEASSCANVTIRSSGGDDSDVILNLGAKTSGDTACLSGGLGSIPISVRGAPGTFANAQVAMTIGPDGFSDGLLGATADTATATAIAGAISEDAANLVSLTFDIDEALTQDTSVACNALSLSLLIGGVTQAPAP